MFRKPKLHDDPRLLGKVDLDWYQAIAFSRLSLEETAQKYCLTKERVLQIGDRYGEK